MNSKNINWTKTFSLWAILVMLIGGFFSPLVMAQQKPEDELAELFGPMVNFEYAGPEKEVVKYFGEGMIQDTLHNGIVSVSVNKDHRKAVHDIAPNELWRVYERYLWEDDDLHLTTRRRIDSLLKITGYRVALTIVLVDDEGGLSEDEYSLFTTRFDSETGKRHVWPSVGNDSDDDGTGYYSAWAYVGAHWLKKSAMVDWHGTKKRDISKQDAVLIGLIAKSIFVFDPSPFAALNEEASGFKRGNGRWVEELWPDKKNATIEGISAYYAMEAEAFSEYAGSEFSISQGLYEFQHDTSSRYVLQETSILASIDNLKKAPYKKRDLVGVMGREYYWLDVPGFYLLFAPNTTFGYLDAMLDGAFGMGNSIDSSPAINKAVAKMWESRDNRDLLFLVNQMALAVEDFSATPKGKKIGPIPSSMYTFYVLDVLTHFDLGSEGYKRAYNNREYERQPRAYKEYWKHRDKLKKLYLKTFSPGKIDLYGAFDVGREYFLNPKYQLKTQVQ